MICLSRTRRFSFRLENNLEERVCIKVFAADWVGFDAIFVHQRIQIPVTLVVFCPLLIKFLDLSMELNRSILDFFCTRKMLMNSTIGIIYVGINTWWLIILINAFLGHRLTTPI